MLETLETLLLQRLEEVYRRILELRGSENVSCYDVAWDQKTSNGFSAPSAHVGV